MFKNKKLAVAVLGVVVLVGALNAQAFTFTRSTSSGVFGNSGSRNYSWGSGTTTTSTTSVTPKNDPACAEVARIAKVTASSYQDWSTRPDLAVDSLVSTAWKSQSGAPQWIQVELDGEYDVTGVRLNVKQTPDALSVPRPTPAVHKIFTGVNSADTLAATLNQDLYNGYWKKVTFTNTQNNTKLVRIYTQSSPAAQVAWNEIEVCGVSAVSSSWSFEPSYLKAQDGSGYAVVNFCQGRYHILDAYAEVPAQVKVLEGSYTGVLPSLAAGQYGNVFVDAKNFVGQSPWQGAALGNGTFVKFGLVSNSDNSVLASVGVSRNDSGCYGKVNTQDGSNYGVVDKCTGGQHVLSIYSQVPATLKVSGGSYSENVNFNVDYDTYSSFIVEASKFTEPSPWDPRYGYNGDTVGNGTAVTFTLYRDDLGTELASATISRNDSCETVTTYNYPPTVTY